jgi:hypothetical protein
MPLHSEKKIRTFRATGWMARSVDLPVGLFADGAVKLYF